MEIFEQRLGEFVGRDVGQGLWFGDAYLFYGTDDWEEGSYFGVRKMDVPRGSWSVLCHSDRGGEAVAAGMTNRFEDAWKSAMAQMIKKVFRGSDLWHAGRRTGVFFNCVPPQVDKLVLTEELTREVYDMDSDHKLSDRDKILLRRTSDGLGVLAIAGPPRCVGGFRCNPKEHSRSRMGFQPFHP